MERSAAVLVALAVVAVGLIAFVFWPAPQTDAGAQTRRDDGEGGVTFEATLHPSSPPYRFTVRLETHTVDLDAYDPLANIVLRQAGQELRAAAESRVVSRSSHHVDAELVFEGASGAAALVLVAQGLAGVAERALEFSP